MGKPAAQTPKRASIGNNTSVIRRRGGFRFQAGGKSPGGLRARTQGLRAAYSKQWLETTDQTKKPFEEDIFATTFGKENIEKLVSAVKQATDTEVNESNRLLNDDYIYSLQITSHRAPHVPVHLSRILLPHSIEANDSDICLFVKDIKRGRRLDYEPTIKFYEQLLRAKKIERNITVIPVNQLYNDYATFELRRKLTYLFDKFLVDKSVASHVNGFLGHKLLLKGRSAIPIDLESEELADEIDTGLRKVFYKHINNGITQMVQVGRHSMSDEHIGENIIDLVRQLGTLHPGGSQNVYKLHIKPNVNISVAVPVYVDMAKPVLETPVETGPTEKTLAEAGEQAADILENFEINQAGDILEKVRRQGTSIVGNTQLASDGEEHIEDGDESLVVAKAPAQKNAAPKTPAAKGAAAKKAAAKKAGPKAAAASDETVISELIMKNLKKLVGNQNKLPALTQGGGGAVANKINKNRPAVKNARPNNAGNRGQAVGGPNRGPNRPNQGGNFNQGGSDFGAAPQRRQNGGGNRYNNGGGYGQQQQSPWGGNSNNYNAGNGGGNNWNNGNQF